MKTEYDKELLFALGQKILSGSVKIHEQTDRIIEEIEAKFAMGLNGIDWEKHEIIFSEHSGSNQDDYLNEAGKFLKKIKDTYPYLLDERIIVLGDGLINLSYEMKFSDFLSLYDKFLSIPQHTYIWFIEPKKCINFTFENEMYFG
jgi:hypothetical protein